MTSNKSATILLSRQNLRPSLNDTWVKNLIPAVKYVQDKGWALNSSVGTPNWDIISACASIRGVPLRLFVAQELDKDEEEFLTSLYPIEVIRVKSNTSSESDKANWTKRDKTIVNLSDVLIPISIRPKGLMSSFLVSAQRSGKSILNDFETRYDTSKKKLAYLIDQSKLSIQIRRYDKKILIHWTRSSNGPWPNESLLNYYRDILKSDQYPRSAIDTLRKISTDKIIIASSKNMPGRVPTVSFSSLPPLEAVKLMKWRARYRQMTFEPYGIGITADIAESYGIKKVQYYDSYSKKEPESTPNWLNQSIGKITDWRNESEYRHLHNLDLSRIPVENLLLVCHYQSDADKLRAETGIETKYFFD